MIESIDFKDEDLDLPATLVIEGTPDSLLETYGAMPPSAEMYVAGLCVDNVTDGAKHDGLPAINIALHDDNGKSRGRLVLVHASAETPYHEILPQWEIVFEDMEYARSFYDRFTSTRKSENAVVTVTQDFVFREDIQLELIDFCAEYGVQAEIVSISGPAGGWPVVKFTGRYNNVERMLLEGFSFPEAEVLDMLS